MPFSDSNLVTSTAEISFKNLQHNFELLTQTLSQGTRMLCMVKANAYGHGINILQGMLSKFPIAGLGVATIKEALALRRVGFTKKVLCMGRINQAILKYASENNITIVLHSLQDIQTFAQSPFKPLCHLELETGMHRLGLDAQALTSHEVFNKDLLSPYVEGVFSHFAQSQQPQSAFTQSQTTSFLAQATLIENHIGKPLIRHLGNSGSILAGFEQDFDWVRPGLALYGYTPNGVPPSSLKPILTWKAPIIQTKTLRPGDRVGYGCEFKASTNMNIATVGVGYGDGFMRSYARMGVALENQRCPVIGDICMDLIMIDVSDIKNPKPGDQVYLLGDSLHGEATADAFAKVDQTISYEVLTRINHRVTRKAV